MQNHPFHLKKKIIFHAKSSLPFLSLYFMQNDPLHLLYVDLLWRPYVRSLIVKTVTHTCMMEGVTATRCPVTRRLKLSVSWNVTVRGSREHVTPPHPHPVTLRSTPSHNSSLSVIYTRRRLIAHTNTYRYTPPHANTHWHTPKHRNILICIYMYVYIYICIYVYESIYM